MEAGILLFIQDHIRCAVLDAPMRILSMLGDNGIFWIVLTIILLCFKSTRKSGLCMACAMIIGLLVSNVALKNIIHRTRPYDVIDTLNILVEAETDFSFPSGHATNSFAAAWALFRTNKKKLGVPALILAALIALARLYVGVHYPTDVLAGVAIGMLAGEAGARFVPFLLSKKKERKNLEEL